LAYFYFEDAPGRRSVAHPPTKPASSFGANLASPASVCLTMKTLDEPSDNKRSKDRRIVERLQNAVSETQQSIVQTQAVIHEVRRLVGLA
jgi:hypothetical protein